MQKKIDWNQYKLLYEAFKPGSLKDFAQLHGLNYNTARVQLNSKVKKEEVIKATEAIYQTAAEVKTTNTEFISIDLKEVEHFHANVMRTCSKAFARLTQSYEGRESQIFELNITPALIASSKVSSEILLKIEIMKQKAKEDLPIEANEQVQVYLPENGR